MDIFIQQVVSGLATGSIYAALALPFYIDKTGKVAAIDTAVRPATSAEDMIAKLDALKVAKKSE